MAKPYSGGAERATFVNEAITGALDILHMPEVQEVLGDFGPTLEELVGGDFYVPNHSAGAFTLPRSKVDKEAIPVIAVKPGESMWVEGMAMTPAQRINAQTFLGALPRASGTLEQMVTEQIADLASVDTGRKYAHEMGRFLAQNCVPQWKTPLSPRPLMAVLHGRPLIMLKFVDYARSSAPFAILHEAIHARKLVQRPLRIGVERELGVAEEVEVCSIQEKMHEGAEANGGFKPADPAAYQRQRAVSRRNAGYLADIPPAKNYRIRIPRKIMKAMLPSIDSV